MIPEPIAVTLLVIEALDDLGVPYFIGGEVSERQWRDVQGILKVQGTRLDLTYLRQWANALNVVDLLEGALREAGMAQ